MENDLKDNLENKTFKVLVCIDGTDESYRGLRYAVRLGSGTDANITLLYVRSVDKDLHTDGLDMRMARENMLDWGLEMPGMAALKRGLDMLVDMDYMDRDWCSETSHVDIQGDPLGDNLVKYTCDDGRKVTLKLIVAPSPDLGILDESDLEDYDITIASASDPEKENELSISFTSSVTDRIATESRNTVIIAKALEENHGHLVCLNGSKASLNTARTDAILANRCNCPITLFSVASDATEVPAAQAIIDEAKNAIKADGYEIAGEKIAIGDPVEEIIEEGKNYSLIVLSGEPKVGIRRFFKSSLIYQILDQAQNSVLLSR